MTGKKIATRRSDSRCGSDGSFISRCSSSMMDATRGPRPDPSCPRVSPPSGRRRHKVDRRPRRLDGLLPVPLVLASEPDPRDAIRRLTETTKPVSSWRDVKRVLDVVQRRGSDRTACFGGTSARDRDLAFVSLGLDKQRAGPTTAINDPCHAIPGRAARGPPRNYLRRGELEAKLIPGGVVQPAPRLRGRQPLDAIREPTEADAPSRHRSVQLLGAVMHPLPELVLAPVLRTHGPGLLSSGQELADGATTRFRKVGSAA